MRFSKTYLIIFGLLFAAFVVVFNTFPRSTFSELEKRELAKFPELTTEKLINGSFTSEVSSWFSDSEPFRDRFMWLSMQVKDHIRLNTGEENVTFHAAEASPESNETMPDPEFVEETIAPEAPEQPYNYENHVTADENAKIANAGIIIVGSDDNVRALMAYGGSAKGGTGYAKAANLYKDTFPSVNVYCMVIPTAVEFYCPEKVKSRTRPQRPTIENIFRHLSPDVKPVDIYATLGEHADEDIFLRTDHHWAPLGAFYAAQKFAEVAGVPFHIDYTIDENYRVIGMGRPHKGIFFHHFKDGSGAAYCTFMGSDTRITRVKTNTHNGRRVLILKDSFGNALPGYLFYSFEEVHVIDSRYFTKNMVEYVKENQITDILFANNIFKAYSSGTYAKYIRYLKQTNGLQKPIIKQMADSTLQKATIQDSATAVQAVKPAMPKIKKDSVAN